jgi:hypothetical protein
MSWKVFLLSAGLLLTGEAARAQSLVDEVPEDPCERAAGLAYEDESPAAQEIRRQCHLEKFENRLTTQRDQSIATAERTRQAQIDRWVDETQPARATRPFFVEGFLGTGIATYGLSAGWDVRRDLELSAWLGTRSISCDDQDNYGNTLPGAASCARTSFGFHGRWFAMMSRISPFLGAGLTITSAHLQIVSTDNKLLSGEGRANSLNFSGGLLLGISAFRLSVEYVYEYGFYTGASLESTNGVAEAKKPPSPELNKVWSSSLQQDRNGIRAQVGYAF